MSFKRFKMLSIEDDVLPRWQKAIANDRLIEWRSYAFLLSAEAKLAEIENQYALKDDLLTLHFVAMQHVFDMYPKEMAA